jgi:hypothetical protein
MQGNALSQVEIRTIVSLLKSTDMALGDIAERMGCSRSAVASINRRFQIRMYAGQRSRWSVAADGMKKHSESARSTETVQS